MRSVREVVTSAQRDVAKVGADRAARELAAGALLVDVREPGEVEYWGSISGATLIPRGVLEFRADPDGARHDPRLRPDRRVLVCCDTGERSALAAATLQAMGYTDVAYVDGGIAAWCAAGFATSNDVELQDTDAGEPRRRSRPKTRPATGVIAGVALAVGIGLVGVYLSDAPESPPAATPVTAPNPAPPSVSTTTIPDPLVVRFGVDLACVRRVAETHDPLVTRYARCDAVPG
jgi:rhodanese-related sulfurtransferase